jgi:hypothetical protein
MLAKLRLLHAYLGGLIDEAETGGAVLEEVTTVREEGYQGLVLRYSRTPVSAGCDHEYRRIVTGEYECSNCGAITDEPEGEQWP